ncbi:MULTISPECIES: hypothetical protein [Brucella/Ochrobactrum group]|uniref:Transposase n=2 Tax=Ochrobactrum TaxID=528 RepID=A0ABD5JUX2_9HYPH|nr:MULTISPECIES: hypothetical protein [Brucella]MCI1001251.1 hypothetical protein [Ochrobactrum sp. C6C9]MDX4075939.1 hypothetical protein [Brucella sp. NBRC 113783]NNU59657.1 hypothetical protein [[Ochrobactrum] soli]WHT43262.1 hypothetical protein QLQ11_15205 [Ochrobactrum sp. SSR]
MLKKLRLVRLLPDRRFKAHLLRNVSGFDAEIFGYKKMKTARREVAIVFFNNT